MTNIFCAPLGSNYKNSCLELTQTRVSFYRSVPRFFWHYYRRPACKLHTKRSKTTFICQLNCALAIESCTCRLKWRAQNAWPGTFFRFHKTSVCHSTCKLCTHTFCNNRPKCTRPNSHRLDSNVNNAQSATFHYVSSRIADSHSTLLLAYIHPRA